MEINTKQNLLQIYLIAIISIMLIPEVIYLIQHGFDDFKSVGYGIGYRIGTAIVYLMGIVLISGGFFLSSYFLTRNLKFLRFLKILSLFSVIYLLISLYYTFA